MKKAESEPVTREDMKVKVTQNSLPMNIIMDGKIMDIARIAEIGKDGISMLLCESTNAQRAGFTPSERTVGNSLDRIFMQSEGKRLIIATFSSNIHRVQQIINASAKYGRHVAVLGRSMNNILGAAVELGYMDLPDGVLIDINEIRRYRPENLTLVTTGSQGEPMSALYRMAMSTHDKVELGAKDLVIISAHAIPGNEKLVDKIVNEMFKKSVTVLYDSLVEVHVSGHACREEIKLMHALTKPEFFMPVHGEYRHLKKHVDLAVGLGLNPACALIAQIGSAVSITQKQMKFTESFHAGATLVDGDSMDGNDEILADRRHMAEDGLLVLALTLSAGSGELLAPPKILCKGFLAEGLDKLLTEGAFAVATALSSLSKATREEVISTARRALKNCVYRSSKQNPVIVTAVTEI
jgi:ribonuclease J